MLNKIAFFALVLIFNTSYSQNEDKEPVNILVLLSDDQRWDALGFAGNTVIETPELDKLAQQGVYFKNGFVTTPICAVSRATVFTGQYAQTHGVNDFATPIDLRTSYPAILNTNGYYTGFIGKWGINDSDMDYFREVVNMFDYWGGSTNQANYWHEKDCNYVQHSGVDDKHNFLCNCPTDNRGVSGEGVRIGRKDISEPVHLTTRVIPEKVSDFLKQRDKSKPFCLSVSFKSPHGPWADHDTTYNSRFVNEPVPLSGNVDVEDAKSRPDFLKISLNGDLEKIKDKSLKGRLQNSIRKYYRLIEGMDYAVGKIMGELKAQNLDENTIILFLSDNGMFLGEHGFRGKWLMYEESVKVPFFIYDPRMPDESRGKILEQIVANIDVAPTILDLAGIEVPSFMDGKSISGLLTNPNQNFRDHLFLEHLYGHGKKQQHIERSRAVRTKHLKYINYSDQTGPLSEELYNIIDDPLEMKNLSTQEANSSDLKQMRSLLSRYLEK
jgi:arylsulfatase A-like enzyme